MKPEFVKDQVWQALPGEVQEAILDQGALLFRKGAEPEDAFWIALEDQKEFVSDLYAFFNVGNPPKGVQWNALLSDDSKGRRSALNAILRAYFLASHGQEEFLKFADVTGLSEALLVDRPRLRCAFCFGPVTDVEDVRVGSLKVHHRCKSKLLTLGETLWDIIDDEFQKSRALGLGEDLDEVEVEYPEFLSIFGETESND